MILSLYREHGLLDPVLFHPGLDHSGEGCHGNGRQKDKISKGDVAGLFMKQGGLKKEELGLIELTQDCVYVAVPKIKSATLIDKLNNSKLKTKKVRISLLN